MKENITIIGTGAYGTVLANVLADNGHEVLMYGIDEEQVEDINENHLNSFFFKDILINENIKATTDLPAALEKCNILVLGVPSVALDTVLNNLIKFGKREMHILNIAKGLDGETLGLLSDKVKNKLKDSGIMKTYGAIFGPSVAIECIQRKPTCVMSCNEDIEVAKYIADIFTNEYFVVEPTTNLKSTEVSAALKNAVAIANGIMSGLHAGDNTRASLITMGYLEIGKIAQCFDPELKDFTNYGTLGDLILTATSPKSRNFSLGYEIAQMGDAQSVLRTHKATVEGVAAAKVGYEIAQKHQINAPLFEMLYKILYNNTKPNGLRTTLFSRK